MSYRRTFVDLLTKLYDQTNAGNIEWSVNSTFDESYIGKIGNYYVSIREGENARSEPIISISILNEQKIEVDSFNDDDLKGMDVPNGDFGGFFSYMSDLFNLARRSAKGADAILQDMLRNLG